MRSRLVVGCMTGTSLDGLDAALVEVRGRGLAMRVRLVEAASAGLGDLGPRLAALARQESRPVAEWARCSAALGEAHARLLKRLLGRRRPVLAALHGQTLYHGQGVSLQALNPHPVAAALGVPVLFDFRGSDIAWGGQGAPISPLADWVLLRDPHQARVVVNLGGFANYTRLAADRGSAAGAVGRIRAGDICTCNQLLDRIARKYFKSPYDAGGRRAAKGCVLAAPGRVLLRRLKRQADSGRSLGTGDELWEWLEGPAGLGRGPDLAATACWAIGQVIAQVAKRADCLILAGGGARNRTLVAALEQHSHMEVCLSDQLGVPGAYREAMVMAVLGALAADGVPVTLAQVTGRGRKAKPVPCWAYP